MMMPVGGSSSGSSSGGSSSQSYRDEEWYDQTKLDGISQLWGLKPDEIGLDRDAAWDTTDADGAGAGEPSLPPTPEYSAWGISQLWYEGDGSLAADREVMLDEDNDSTAMKQNYAGVKQLWTGSGGGSSSRLQKEEATVNALSSSSLYDGIDWFDEVGPDGKELRLSQMLADEVWEEEESLVEEQPITYEEYVSQVEEIMESQEKERLETEAIMNAGPLANYLEGIDDEDDNEEEEDDISLKELEMDVVADWEKEDYLSLVDANDDIAAVTPDVVAGESISDIVQDAMKLDDAFIEQALATTTTVTDAVTNSSDGVVMDGNRGDSDDMALLNGDEDSNTTREQGDLDGDNLSSSMRVHEEEQSDGGDGASRRGDNVTTGTNDDTPRLFFNSSDSDKS